MLKVLVIDDELSVLETVSNMLSARGFAVGTCSNGDAAVRSLRERTFDVVLSDVIMEGLVGTALLNAIRAIPGCAEMPVAFMSNMPEQRVRRLIVGDYAVIRKPFQVEQLLRAIDLAARVVSAPLTHLNRSYDIPPQHSRWQ